MAQSIIRTQKIDALIVHHTVTPQLWSKEQTMKNLNSSSMAYDGKSPYTYVGGHNWSAVGRPDNTVGYQSGSTKVTNQQSMGIVLVGNFQEDTLTEFQKKWLGDTLKALMKKYGVPRNRVFLHRDVRDEPTACPGSKITQELISKLLSTPTPSPMPTCEQQLAEEKKQHAETVARADGNYKNWQEQLDRANRLERELTDEKRQHGETVQRADDNYKNWQAALDAKGPLEEAIKKVREIVGS